MSTQPLLTFEDIYKGQVPWLKTNTLFCTLHGSRAYGLHTPESDVDIKGLAVAPSKVYLGYRTGFEQAEQHEPTDLVIYEIRKFFKLAEGANPNILEILFTDPSDYIFITPLGQRIVDNRDKFLSLRALHTFMGYATAQLHRILVHQKWLRNPPEAPPVRGDFGLEECPVIPKEQLGAAGVEIQKRVESFDFDWSVLEEADRINLQNNIRGFFYELGLSDDEVFRRTGRNLGYDTNFLQILQKERQYTAKHREWEQFQGWKKNRNQKRAAMEAKWGYDCKNASHLYRLTVMTREILTEGKVKVKRTEDREEILAIKNGSWPYEKLMDWHSTQEAELRALAKSCTILPKEPDKEFLDNLCQEIVSEFHGF